MHTRHPGSSGVRAKDNVLTTPSAYVHDTEGPDDMAAHARAMLTSNSLTIPVSGGIALPSRWLVRSDFVGTKRPGEP